MSQINCNIIADLMELYADNVVSEDTKVLVAGHLRECSGCSDMLTQIKKSISIPAEVSAEPIKKIKSKLRKKLLITSLISTVAIAAILLGAFAFITRYKVAMPYERTHIFGVEQGGNDFEIIVNFMDSIEKYAIFSKHLDDETMEYYVFFYDTYHSRYFSNSVAVNSFISIPAYEEMRLSQDDEFTRVQTVRIYYCTYGGENGRIDLSERHLIWEKK